MFALSDSTDPEIRLAGKVLTALDEVARQAEIDYMVVGATARNILSAALFARLPQRATRDVDIAVGVRDWEAYQRLTAALPPRRGAHCFWVHVDGAAVEVDVVPYGDIEGPGRVVRLPDDHDLNVLGFREVYAAAVTVRLPATAGTVDVRVPTVAGLVLLKIVAWTDRRLQHRRDAVDLDELIGWYSKGSLLDDLYADVEVLGRYDFDVELAGAYRLGSDIAGLLGEEAAHVPGRGHQVVADRPLHRRLVQEPGRLGGRGQHELVQLLLVVDEEHREDGLEPARRLAVDHMSGTCRRIALRRPSFSLRPRSSRRSLYRCSPSGPIASSCGPHPTSPRLSRSTGPSATPPGAGCRAGDR